jgi:hypothetical protein
MDESIDSIAPHQQRSARWHLVSIFCDMNLQKIVFRQPSSALQAGKAIGLGRTIFRRVTMTNAAEKMEPSRARNQDLHKVNQQM